MCFGGGPAYFLEDYSVSFSEDQEPGAVLEPQLLSYQPRDNDLALAGDPRHFKIQDNRVEIRQVLLINHPNLKAKAGRWNRVG